MNIIKGRINKELAEYIKLVGAGGDGVKRYYAGYGINIDDENNIISVDTNEVAIKEDIIFDKDEATTVSIGGIKQGTVLDNIPITDILEDMLYPYVPFSIGNLSTNLNSTIFEVGSSLQFLSISVPLVLGSDKVKSIIITLDGVEIGRKTNDISSSNIISLSQTLTSQEESVFNVVATVSDGITTLSKNIKLNFYYSFYYGTLSHTQPYTSEEILTLSSGVNSYGYPTVYTTFTMNFSCVVVATTSIINKITDQNGYNVTSSFEKSNLEINGVLYNIYSLMNISSNEMQYKFT